MERSGKDSRRNFLKVAGTTGAVAGIGSIAGCLQTARELRNRAESAKAKAQDGTNLRVKQESDKLVYWVLPGQRRLSEQVFGTPDNPKSLVQPKIEQAESPVIKQLLRDLPALVGLPPEARATNEDGTKYTRSKIPTIFSDKGGVVNGSFEVVYKDRQPTDSEGEPSDTEDEVELTAEFTDPADNQYEMQFDHVVQPPIPGYDTRGGVFIDGYHHGLTGTGSPLMPRVYTYGALYGVGNLVVNGETVDENKVIHVMTTQTVRDKNYRLAIGEELPLKLDNTIAGQAHHTHVLMFPIKATPDGPKHEPVKTAFELPSGETQPFIHAMYEQDTVVNPPFEPQISTPMPQRTTEVETTTQSAETVVEGREYFFNPETVEVNQGENVTITFRNAGSIAHNFTLPAFDARTTTIQPGKLASVSFTANQTGEFPFWCSVPGHRQAGMEGTLVVK